MIGILLDTQMGKFTAIMHIINTRFDIAASDYQICDQFQIRLLQDIHSFKM